MKKSELIIGLIFGAPQSPLGRDLGTGNIPEVVHQGPFRRVAGVLPVQATQLPRIYANSALTPNQYPLQLCLSTVTHERFAESLVLEAEGFDEALPGLVSQIRREANPSVLEINEAGLVVVRKVRRHWTSPIAMFPDIVEFLVL